MENLSKKLLKMKKKRILQIVEKCVEASFQNGVLKSANVKRIVKNFKAMSLHSSILYLSEYTKLLKSRVEKTVLSIHSSTPLSPLQKKAIIRELKKDYEISKVEAKTDPSLLAGVSIRISDMVYEDTLHTRLEQMKEAIVNV